MHDDFLDYYRQNPDNFSNWYPKIIDCGIKVPKSIIIETPDEVAKAYFMDKASKDEETVLGFVIDKIIPKIIDKLKPTTGFLFMKNATFSNKFKFSSCGFLLTDPLRIAANLIDINYTAEMFGAGGLSEIIIRDFIGDVFYTKKNIPAIYGGMPLRPEFRVFYNFDKSKIVGKAVNYWNWDYCYKKISENATDKMVFETYYDTIEKFYQEHKIEVEQMVDKAMKNVKGLAGNWYVDIMYEEKNNEYWLIDMAKGGESPYWSELKI